MAEWRQKLAEYRRIPGLQQQLSKSAGAMCAPFWWSLQEQPGQRAHILRNGTICFVNTGSAELGVTADHVLNKYLSQLAEYGDVALECQFGGSTISPENRVLDRHTDLDLATIHVPEVFITAAVSPPRMQHKPLSWPPARAQIGELVVYGGHPGILREEKVQVADFPFQWVMGGVSDVSENRIILEPGFEKLTWLNPEPGKEFNRDFSGMSGGPVFRVIDQPLLRLELIGFINEYVDDQAVLARHADLITAEGYVTQ